MKYCKLAICTILTVVLCLPSLYGITENVTKSVYNCGDEREHDYSLAPRELSSSIDVTCNKEDIGKLRESAEKGNVKARYELGWRYWDGEGVEQNTTNAVAWFERAASVGDSFAQMMLAVMHLQGKGTEYSESESIKWFQKAIESGLEDRLSKENVRLDPQGTFFLSIMYNAVSNAEKTLFWLRKSADMGYAKAQHELGLKYLSGVGVKKDQNEATEWFRKAAENGYAASQTNLGYAYDHGEGTPQDSAVAVEWYRRAAEGGDAVGQFNLGLAYYSGLALPQQYSESIKWWRKAAAQGHDASLQMLRELEQEIARTQQIKDSAETGNLDAQLQLARRYETGTGVERSYQEAAKWYRTAAYGFKGKWYNENILGFLALALSIALVWKLIDWLWNWAAGAVETAKRRIRFSDSISSPHEGSSPDDEGDDLHKVNLSDTGDQDEGEPPSGGSYSE